MPAPLHRTDGGCGFPTLSLSLFSSLFFPTPPYLYKEQKKGAAPDPLGTNSCGRSRLTYWRGSSTLSRYRCAWRLSPPSVGCTHTTTQNTSINKILVGPTKLSTCSDREYATLLRLPPQQARPSPTRTKAGAYEEPSGGHSLFFAHTSFFPTGQIVCNQPRPGVLVWCNPVLPRSKPRPRHPRVARVVTFHRCRRCSSAADNIVPMIVVSLL